MDLIDLYAVERGLSAQDCSRGLVVRFRIPDARILWPEGADGIFALREGSHSHLPGLG